MNVLGPHKQSEQYQQEPQNSFIDATINDKTKKNFSMQLDRQKGWQSYMLSWCQG